MKKTHYIKTYGCQMNVYDSERMSESLASSGYEPGDSFESADLIILNTCHIREKAAEKVYSELGRINKIRKAKLAQGKRLNIAVTGCVAQAEGEEIKRRAPYVDFVIGPQAYQNLPILLKELELGKKSNVISLDFAAQEKFDQLPEERLRGDVSAFVTVQEGCDKFCTFCVVPYTRGAEFSRSVSEIYRESLMLTTRGTKEISLLGQNVNAYHGDGPNGKNWNLAKLISLMAGIEGLERIRFTTSHPNDMDDELIELFGSEPKLMPFLHLPVQSGSDAILAKMNRKHTVLTYLKIIEKLRKSNPNIAFSSDFIVGFPGETEVDFRATLDLVKEVGYAQAYSFNYSIRPGTPAAEMENQVEDSVKEERLQRLQEQIRLQQAAFNQQQVGSVLPVLFERNGGKEGQVLGKTAYLQSVIVENAQHFKGSLANVRVERAYLSSLHGKIVGSVSNQDNTRLTSYGG